MKLDLKRLDILEPHQWLIMIGGVLLISAVYALLIHPSLKDMTELPRVQEEEQAARKELNDLRDKLQGTERQIRENREALAVLGGAPPPISEKDMQIARLTALADGCGVQVNQVAPIDIVDYADHRAFMVEFAGQGSFISIQQMFELIESQVDFVNVTNFSITAGQPSETSTCRVSWSCRINGINLDLAETPAPPRTEDRGTRREVARHVP